MPDGIDDKVAGAKNALAQANAKFPSPKPTAQAAPASTPKPAPATAKPAASTGEDVATGIAARQRNIQQYQDAPKMHKGGTVPGKPGEEVHIIAKAGEKVIPADKAEGRSSEYRKVYVARRQSRQGGGNTPVKDGEKHDTKKA